MPGIAFDFDMTLAETSEAVYATLLSSFTLVSIPMVTNPTTDFPSLRGLKLREQLIGMSLNQLSESDLEELEVAFMKQYPSIGVPKSKLFSGVRELFETLHACKIPIHIVSAKSPTNLELSLHYLGLEPDKWIGGIFGEQKIDYLVQNSCSTYVGDAPIDAEIARKAFCKAIIINNSNECIGDWVIQPDYVFSNPNDFLSWLRNSKNLQTL